MINNLLIYIITVIFVFQKTWEEMAKKAETFPEERGF